jgi:hypothetical protein
MQLVISDADFSKLKATTRADLIATLLNSAAAPAGPKAEGFAWDEVVDLTPDEVVAFMDGDPDRGILSISERTIAGLKVIAEHGPIIAAILLDEAEIENYGNFQGAVTKRTRTITGNKHARLFAWDDWNDEENHEGGYGHYAVTEKTHHSLRCYFRMI